MTRKLTWVALGIVVGFPVAVVIYTAVVAAMYGDWTGVQFIGGALWFIVVFALVCALIKPKAE